MGLALTAMGLASRGLASLATPSLPYLRDPAPLPRLAIDTSRPTHGKDHTGQLRPRDRSHCRFPSKADPASSNREFERRGVFPEGHSPPYPRLKPDL